MPPCWLRSSFLGEENHLLSLNGTSATVATDVVYVSNLRLFGHFQGIINFYTQVPYGTFQLSVP